MEHLTISYSVLPNNGDFLGITFKIYYLKMMLHCLEYLVKVELYTEKCTAATCRKRMAVGSVGSLRNPKNPVSEPQKEQ